jgi:hypothetical protein
MKIRSSWLGVAASLGFSVASQPALASSHREALAVLDHPCADNTDVYAWVKPTTHDKLYLIMNFLPLHEPGQGNQGLRACEGYRYEFHIGKGASLADAVIYGVTFNKTLAPDAPPNADTPGGSNELLWQIAGGSETFTVDRRTAVTKRAPLGVGLPVAPNDHGPQTDRFVNGLGAFQGYDSGDPTSRTVDLYDDAFIGAHYVHNLSNGGRAFAGQRDDPFYLDEKGIFDLVNLCSDGFKALTGGAGLPGARTTDCEDVFAGFNLFTIALEIPISDLFPGGVPHPGVNDPTTTDSLLRVWAGIYRTRNETPDVNATTTGYTHSGLYDLVGREALPLFNAGLVGTGRQTRYLRTTPMTDVSNFGGDILYPVLVRDAELLGIYAALGLPQATIDLLKFGPGGAGRLDIIHAITLGRTQTGAIPIADGFVGDVITIDAALDSVFPNGRSLDVNGGIANREPVDVSDALIGLIAAGAPGAVGDGVDRNDKDYLPVFPYVAGPHSGLNGGHGATNQP